MNHSDDIGRLTRSLDPEIEHLLCPGRVYARPQDVVHDPGLALDEKRAVLASWASDACAVEAMPAIRRIPGSDRTVSVDEILEALRALDREARRLPEAPRRGDGSSHAGAFDDIANRSLEPSRGPTH